MSSSSVLGTLVVRIAAEMRQYKADMEQAASVTQDSAKKIERANSDVTASQEKLISSAGAAGAAVGLAAVAAAAGVGLMVKSAIDNADAVGKLSSKTGIATETLSAYQLAASLSNVSNETLATGMKMLSKNVADGAEVLGRMGVATKDSNGNLRSLDAVMGDVADKFNGYKDGAGKAALAQEVFGRSGMDMINMLNDGSEGLAAMRKEAEELGLVIDGTTAKAAAEFNDNLTRLHARSQGYAASLAAQLLPALTAVTESFIEGGRNSGFMHRAVGLLADGLKGLISVGYGVAAVFEQVGTYFGGLAAAAVAMLRGDFGQVKTIFADMSADMSAKAAASGARINQVWSAIGDGAKKAGAEMDKVDAPGKIEKVGKAAKAALTDAERMAQAGEKLAASLLAQEHGLSGDFAQKWEQLGAAYKAGAISLDVLVQAQARLLAQQPGIKAATEAMDKANLSAAQAHEKYVESLGKGLAKIEEDIAQQRLHNAEIGLGKDAVAELTAARLEDQAAMLEGQAIKQMDKNLDQVQYELLMAQARALRELAALKREGGAAQVALDEAKEAQKAWEKAAGQIEQSLSDALMNAFTAGKGFGQTFVNSIKAMFNTMVLRPVISAIVRPVAGAITSALGFSGAANAATGTGAVSSGLLGAAGVAGLGSAMGSSFGAAFGATLSGEIGSALSAGTAMLGMEGGLMTGLSTLAGALGPIALGIGAVYMLAKKLDHSGTPHTGGGSAYSAAGGLLDARSSVFNSGFTGIAYSDSTTQMTAGLVQSIVGILDSTATTFGKEAGYQAAASFADDSSKDGAWGSLFIKNMQGVLTDWQAGGVSFRTFSDGSAGSAEYLAAVSADVRKAIDGIGLPAWATGMLDKLGDAPALDQLAGVVQQINATQAALVQMRSTLDGFSGIGDEAALKLIDASGGVAQLAANAGAYFQAMYTEDEKKAAVTRQYTQALQAVNQAVPTSITAYRQQVAYLQSIVDTEPAAAQALAVMYAVGPAFASVNQPVAELASTVVDTAEEIATLEQALAALRNPVRTIEDIAQSIVELERAGAGLGVELLAAQGDTAGARAGQRALDTAGFSDAELALYDYNQSLRDQIDALNAATAASEQAIQAAQERARAIESERTGLQQQLDLLTGATTQRQIERAALDESNRALYDQITALQDQADAADAAARASAEAASELQRAADAAAAAAQRIASEHDGLWRQWLQASGDTAALRALELAALDPSNRALQEQIWALEDQAAAADAAARANAEAASELQRAADAAAAAAQRIASEHDGLWRQWLQASGDTAALRALELAALDPSNRALQEQIWALEDQQAAADEAAAAAQTAADEQRQAAEALAAAAQKIASEHDGLWRQWLQASGDTAALRALELAALDPSNRALQEQIWALEDQQAAADEAAAAAEQMKSAWASLTDSITDEVRRIRGLVDDGSGASYASLAAQFAVATAQTRAGDQDAARLLPGLSQGMLSAYEATAASLVDLQRVRAMTANSLETTASLVGGVTPDGYATGSGAIGAALSAQSQAATAQTTELQGLRAEVAALRTALEAVVVNTGKGARLAQKWDDVGIPVTNTADGTPLSVA